jgi:hypothetical protein
MNTKNMTILILWRLLCAFYVENGENEKFITRVTCAYITWEIFGDQILFMFQMKKYVNSVVINKFHCS